MAFVTSIFQFFNSLLHQRTAAGSTEEESDEVTDRLEDRLKCLAHNFCFLNDEILGFLNTLQRYEIKKGRSVVSCVSLAFYEYLINFSQFLFVTFRNSSYICKRQEQ